MIFDPPALLPASFREQLKALAHYATSLDWNARGGFKMCLTVPIEVLSGDIDENFLREHGINLTIESEQPYPSSCGRIMRYPAYADVIIEYNF